MFTHKMGNNSSYYLQIKENIKKRSNFELMYNNSLFSHHKKLKKAVENIKNIPKDDYKIYQPTILWKKNKLATAETYRYHIIGYTRGEKRKSKTRPFKTILHIWYTSEINYKNLESCILSGQNEAGWIDVPCSSFGPYVVIEEFYKTE